ncbi:MAG: conjugal transfer protein TraF, partial [Endomicrobium sp.]|nr:conjugal transfer protein TraF [Endomicrobium sp.]
FVGGKSFGIDLGTIYHLRSHWNIGLSIADFYGSEIEYKKLDLVSLESSEICYTAQIKPKLNFGVAYINGKFVFAFDLTDLINPDKPFNFNKTAFEKLHIGAEYKFGPFVIRGGFNSGYPTIGGGITVFNVFHLEYAFYGEEKGTSYTDKKPVWFHKIIFSCKF